jgi:hypothetical protein
VSALTQVSPGDAEVEPAEGPPFPLLVELPGIADGWMANTNWAALWPLDWARQFISANAAEVRVPRLSYSPGPTGIEPALATAGSEPLSRSHRGSGGLSAVDADQANALLERTVPDTELAPHATAGCLSLAHDPVVLASGMPLLDSLAAANGPRPPPRR